MSKRKGGRDEEQDQADPCGTRATLSGLSLLLVVACGNVGGTARSSGGGGGPTITVGSKNFTEQILLGEHVRPGARGQRVQRVERS